MPSLQSFAATFSNIFGGGQPDLAAGGGVNNVADNKNSGANQFASLLDVVGNIGDDNKPPVNIARKDDVRDPVAAEVDVPAPFRDNSIKDTKQSKVNDDSNGQVDRSGTFSASKNNNKADSEDTTENVTKSVPKDDGRNDVSGQKTELATGKADKASNDNEVSGSGDEISELDKLKEKIADKIDSLRDIMAIIAQLLSGTNVAVARVDVSFTQTIQVAVAGDNTNIAGVTGDQATEPFAVFANIKDILAQLEQFLQGANGQTTPLTQEQNDMLSAINNALQVDLDALKNLFPQAAGGDDTQSIFNQLLNSQQPDKSQSGVAENIKQADSAQYGDAEPLLHDDIALIREALLKFRDDRLSDVQKIAGNQQNLQDQALPAITSDADNLDTGSIKTEAGKVDSIIFSSIAANSVNKQSSVSQGAQQQNNNPSVPVAAMVDAPSANKFGGSADANAGGNSGQGGNSGAQLSFGASSLGSQARTASASSHTQFSSLLNRTLETPVAEQVVFHVKTLVGKGDSKITIQLNPEELGKLDITLDVDARGKTGVTITADNKQTLELLQRDSQGLQKALSDAGLKADSGSLSFNLRGGEREGQGQNGSQAANTYKKSQPDESPEEVSIASLASVTRSYVINLPDGLDIKI